MLQDATPLRKSGPGPPNSSDEHVSCTAPATRNASLQILFKCPTPAIVFGKPQNSHVLLTFDNAHNPLRLPRKTISERPKVLQTHQFFALLTSKCASHHNGVHFFDISTSKSGPNMKRFVHFEFQMCFAPQRRALFRHRNFQKWSDAEVFCTFFSEPTFRPSGATNHWKNTVFRDFPTFSRTWTMAYHINPSIPVWLVYQDLQRTSEPAHVCVFQWDLYCMSYEAKVVGSWLKRNG